MQSSSLPWSSVLTGIFLLEFGECLNQLGFKLVDGCTGLSHDVIDAVANGASEEAHSRLHFIGRKTFALRPGDAVELKLARVVFPRRKRRVLARKVRCLLINDGVCAAGIFKYRIDSSLNRNSREGKRKGLFDRNGFKLFKV